MKVNAEFTSAFIIRFALVFAGFVGVGQGAIAQVIPDQTLSNPSQVRVSGSTDVISGGTTAGSNLFHSFSEFSVLSGRTAYFENSLAVNNILARVTGGESSLINGLIKANGTANLFLINPNGILFGPNASLNLGGSFVASTANSLSFANGLQYSAINPQAAPLLAVNVPLGLQYGKTIQPINVIGSSLTVSPGKTLALVGGNVSLQGATLRARGGRIDLGGLSDTGTARLTFSENVPSLNFSKAVSRGNISLTNSDLRVAASGSGDISINARNIDILNSILSTGLLSGTGVAGGKITFSALDQITVTESGVFNTVLDPVVGKGGDIEIVAKSLFLNEGGSIKSVLFGTGSAGDINIDVGSLSLDKGGQLLSDNFGFGNAGKINVNALDLVNLSGTDAAGYPSIIFSNIDKNSLGNGGNISISTKSLELNSNAQILSTTSSDVAGENTQGNGGSISISTKSLALNNEAKISSVTFGKGNAGELNLIAKDLTSVNEKSAIFSDSSLSASGNGGNIFIATGTLSLTNGGIVSSRLYGQGQLGKITIDAIDTVVLDGANAQGSPSQIYSILDEGTQGKGGNISISAKSLALTNGAAIQSITSGSGNAGNLILNAEESIFLNGRTSIIQTGSGLNAIGDSGNISISSKTLKLDNGAIILNSTFGKGKAGNISIGATKTIDLAGLNGIGGISTLIAQTSSGNGGDINISTEALSVSNGAGIGPGLLGTGRTGDVFITASESIYLDGFGVSPSYIRNFPSTSSQGGAGNITLNTKSFVLTNGAVILALQSGAQKTGNIKITATESVNILGANQNGSPSLVSSSTITDLPSGNITISTPILNILDSGLGPSFTRAGITAASFGVGDAGNIFINSDAVTLDGGEIAASMGTQSTGDGGFIRVEASTLTALNRGNIRTTTNSKRDGGAGNITFLLLDKLYLSGNGTGVFANTEVDSTGKGGSIFIDPPNVNITDGASISVNSLGSGTGGSIDLRAGALNLDNGAISAATASSDGGNVNLGVQGLLLANNNSTVSATAGGNGDGGNLDINAGFIVLNNNSDIAANAFQGRGGNIQIATQGLFQSRDSTITASSQLGINGTVQLNVTDLDPSRGLFRLPETVVDASGLVSQKCDATVGKEPQQSEFVVTGKGGLRPNPSESLQDESILSNWATLQPRSGQSSKQPSAMIAPPAQKPDVIAMAQGWKVDSDGTVVLTAEPSSAAAPPTWQPSAKCRA
jgi:filamentous hemagglutinin family protein